MCLHVSCHLADLFGCLWYMVISWSGGTLDDYAVQLAAQQQHGYENNATSASVLRGERYPFNELLAATELGPDGVTRKWLLCYVFAMGMFTGLMPIEMHPWREEEMIFCLVSLVIAMGPSRASFTPHATARTLLPTRLSPHATASQAATLGPRAAGSRCSSVRSTCCALCPLLTLCSVQHHDHLLVFLRHVGHGFRRTAPQSQARSCEGLHALQQRSHRGQQPGPRFLQVHSHQLANQG